MPVEVIWDDDRQTIIRQIYSGIVTLDDYYAAIDAFAELANSVPHPVDSIMDRRAIETTAQGSFINALRYGQSKLPDNMGLRVVIQPGAMLLMVLNIGKMIAPTMVNNLHYTHTLQEARALIARHRDQTYSG